MGGLSLMSVTVMMAVAVLERPKFRLPSMSVACTMMVYCETFCGEKGTTQRAVISLLRQPRAASAECASQGTGFCSTAAVRALV